MSLKKLIKELNVLTKTDKLQRSVAQTMLVATADRIFDQGKAADNSQIGTYSEGYIKQRQKDNYPPSTKVILQATRQMANDWSVVSTGNSIGLGFKNPFNAEKSNWVEDTYKKSIFAHTPQELKLLDKAIQTELNKIISG